MLRVNQQSCEAHFLFIFYASRASRYAYKEINEKCFMELMEDTFAEKQVRVHKNG